MRGHMIHHYRIWNADRNAWHPRTSESLEPMKFATELDAAEFLDGHLLTADARIVKRTQEQSALLAGFAGLVAKRKR